jgi:hypothetical protein
MVVKPLFALKKAHLGAFWLEAGVAPQSIFGYEDRVMRAQLFNSYRMVLFQFYSE